MTCIVGLVHKGEVYIGGDSAGVAWLDLTIRVDQKVFKKDPFVMGFTSSFRMGQLLRYRLNVAEKYPSQGIEEYMVGTFIDAVRKCLKDGGWAQKENEQERGGHFLVGYAGRLWHIQGDYQVGEPAADFDATGCGESYALGVLHATEGMAPRPRIKLALEAAERFSAGVSSPFVIVKGGRAS